MKWNPDPRWPKSVVACAMAIADGIDERPMLHDALVEMGYQGGWLKDIKGDALGPMGLNNWTSSALVGVILNDGYEAEEGWYAAQLREFFPSGSRAPQTEPSRTP